MSYSAQQQRDTGTYMYSPASMWWHFQLGNTTGQSVPRAHLLLGAGVGAWEVHLAASRHLDVAVMPKGSNDGHVCEADGLALTVAILVA
jgi:hypothetical protein